MDYPYSTPSTLRLQPSHNLPPYDPQRNVHRSTLDGTVYRLYHYDRTPTLRAQPPVLCEPAEKRTGLSRRVLMPSEILNEIFVYFHMQDGFIELPINRRDFPWNVAGVCSQWRRVVWSIPGGFRNIAIGALRDPGDLVPAQVQAIQYALLHAFSLSTTLVGIVVYPHLVYFPIPYSHRIRELRLKSINQSMFSSLFQVPPGSFDHLEELDLGLYQDGWIIFPIWSAQVMPTLQALYIDSYQEYSPHPAFSLPWTQLTELEVTDALSADNILHILRHSQRIVRGKFRIIEEAVGPHLPFTLPHLASLSLSHEHPIDAARFLDPLTLPSLEELDITDDEMGGSLDYNEAWSHEPYTALINRSHCAIRRFVLVGSCIFTLDFLEDSIEPLLQALLVVEDLELDALLPSSTFMTIRQNRLLPQLESVAWTLDIAGVWEYTDWLLSFEAGGDHALENATAFFHTERRVVAAETRFIAREADILRAGIVAGLSRCSCVGVHSDGSDGGSDDGE